MSYKSDSQFHMSKPTLIEKLNKTSRLIRRQYRSKAFGTAIGLTGVVAGGFAIGAGVVSGAGIPFVLLMALYAGGGIAVFGEDPSCVLGREYELNGYKLVGSPRDITRVKAVQDYINNRTHGMEYLATLPKDLLVELNQHVADVVPVLKSLRIYKEFRSEDDLSYFQFQRPFIDEKGNAAEQAVSIIKDAPVKALVPPKRLGPVDVMAPVQQAQARCLDEFNVLSDRLKVLSMQVKKLESYLGEANGHASMLEKPKFKGMSKDS